MVLSPWIKRLVYPFLIISQTVPLIAVAPLLILWLGYGLMPKIVIVIIVCYFPVTISLIEGLELTDIDLINLLRSMGASRCQLFYIVRWPHALPSLFAGLKIAATYSVMGAVIGEWLGSSSGLGVYLTRSSHSFHTIVQTSKRQALSLITKCLSLFYKTSGRMNALVSVLSLYPDKKFIRRLYHMGKVIFTEKIITFQIKIMRDCHTERVRVNQ